MSGEQSSVATFLTGTAPAMILWVLVVVALGYGVVKTVDIALALFGV